MPKLSEFEQELLRRLSNKIFDVLYVDIALEEKRANEITEEVMTLIRRKCES